MKALHRVGHHACRVSIHNRPPLGRQVWAMDGCPSEQAMTGKRRFGLNIDSPSLLRGSTPPGRKFCVQSTGHVPVESRARTWLHRPEKPKISMPPGAGVAVASDSWPPNITAPGLDPGSRIPPVGRDRREGGGGPAAFRSRRPPGPNLLSWHRFLLQNTSWRLARGSNANSGRWVGAPFRPGGRDLACLSEEWSRARSVGLPLSRISGIQLIQLRPGDAPLRRSGLMLGEVPDPAWVQGETWVF